MSALVVSGVTKSFGAHPVLAGVDLEVRDGITAVLGSSGCGKTTLLRLVAGFLEPDAGTIALGGEVVAGAGRRVPSRRRRVGYVPQEGALFPHLDVAANIGFGLPRRERGGRRIAEMLELVELPAALADRHPHELSGGQQQRVALARALAPSPALVLLDEPFSSLDATLREDTGRAVVRALRASGAAAVLVTHDQGEALSLADEVAVMTDGRFLQVASPADIYLFPVDAVVASFVGNAVLLPGEVVGDIARSVLGTMPVRPGTPAGAARLAVRPEQVLVSLAAEDGEGVKAEIVGVSFFGHDATVQARVAGSDLVVTARTPAGGVPTTGQQVTLRVVGTVLAFPDPEAS